jgi:hypothetical protein
MNVISNTASGAANKAVAGGGVAFLAPLFAMVPCPAEATACTTPVAAGFLLLQGAAAAAGMGDGPDPAHLSAALTMLWASIGAAVVGFAVTYRVANR